MIALALSGGGSRAIAFHLGCMRALHNVGVLERVLVISAVSGGSLIAGMYAYSDDSFSEFDLRVTNLLSRGLYKAILKELFSPRIMAQIIATNVVSRTIATMARAFKRQPPLSRWASRSGAMRQALEHRLFHEIKLAEVKRLNIDVVFNACELRTGTAFHFSNRCSGNWRLGIVKDNDITVAHAVACSAAYPIYLPGFDQKYTFAKKGHSKEERVILTDGGIYDNLGVSCIEPGRNSDFSLLTYPTEHIICCSAGHGQFTGENIPYGFLSRVNAAFETVFRKNQDAAFKRLHSLRENGLLKGFILSYLGQQDSALPNPTPELVSREEVYGYPTNFAAMPVRSIDRISLRGEQLTQLLLRHYCRDL